MTKYFLVKTSEGIATEETGSDYTKAENLARKIGGHVFQVTEDAGEIVSSKKVF